MNKHALVRLGSVLGGGVVIIGLTGAGCSSGSVSNTPVNNSPAAASASGASAPDTTAAPSIAHVGSAIALTDQKGNKANVTLAQVINPAQGADQFTTPDNGKRFVGLKFVIAATSGTVSDDADSDATIIGSDNQTYQADFSDIAGCTNFDSGTFTVAAGGSSTGCVVYQLPTGVNVSKVRFDIAGGFGDTVAEWLVP